MSTLSDRGCAVFSEEWVEPGMRLVLHIHLSEQHSPITVDSAEVCWALGRRFGVEFLRMSLEARERLHQLVSALAGGHH